MQTFAAPAAALLPPMGKTALRALLWQRRRIIPQDLVDTTRWKVTNHLRTLISGMAPGAVALYYPMVHEIDLRPLAEELWQSGHTVLLPRVVYRGFPLTFNIWELCAPLERDAVGLWAATGPEMTPALMVIPMLGYTRSGYRLGSGGGYYDQTLAALRQPVYTVGVCYTELEVPTLAAEPHDISLHAIVTGKEVIYPV